MGLVYSPAVWPTSEVNVGTIFTWLENHIYIHLVLNILYLYYLHLEHLQPNIANVPEQLLNLRYFGGGDSLTKLSSPSKIWPPFRNLKS